MADPGPGEPHRLRPMQLMQILDTSIRMYRENFFLFFSIAALPTLPLLLVQMGLQTWEVKLVPQMDPYDFGSQPVLDSRELATSLLFKILIAVTGLVHAFVAVPLATGALTSATSDRYLGRLVTVGSSFRPVFGMFWRYVLTSVLLALLLGFGGACSCFLLFPLLWIWFVFTPCVMIVEGVTGVPAMGRSKQLGTGHYWRILGAGLTLLLFYFAVWFSLGGAVTGLALWKIESPVLRTALVQAIQVVIGSLVTPLVSLVPILLYYDLRIRKEGFDLALAAQRLSSPPPLA